MAVLITVSKKRKTPGDASTLLDNWLVMDMGRRRFGVRTTELFRVSQACEAERQVRSMERCSEEAKHPCELQYTTWVRSDAF